MKESKPSGVYSQGVIGDKIRQNKDKGNLRY